MYSDRRPHTCPCLGVCSKAFAYRTILKERGEGILHVVEHQLTTAVEALGHIPAELYTNTAALVGPHVGVQMGEGNYAVQRYITRYANERPLLQVATVSTTIDGMKMSVLQQTMRRLCPDSIDYSKATGQLVPHVLQLAGTPGLVAAALDKRIRIDMYRRNELPIALRRSADDFTRARLTGGELNMGDCYVKKLAVTIVVVDYLQASPGRIFPSSSGQSSTLWLSTSARCACGRRSWT